MNNTTLKETILSNMIEQEPKRKIPPRKKKEEKMTEHILQEAFIKNNAQKSQ